MDRPLPTHARLLSALSVFVVSVAASGCATATTDETGAETDAAATHAYLRMDRTVESGDPAQVRTHGSATFLRTHDGADPAVVARLVGAAPTLPLAGQCAALDASDSSLALHTLSPVELTQAGAVAIGDGAARHELLARAYPDVAHLVSGVVYTTAEDAADALPSGEGQVTFHIAGQADVPAFDVDVDVPPALTLVRVDGRNLGDAGAWRDAGSTHVTWENAVEGDSVYVDLSSAIGDHTARYRCVALPGASELTGPEGALLGDGPLTITAHRLRTVRFQAGTLSTGEARFDTAVTGRIGVIPG